MTALPVLINRAAPAGRGDSVEFTSSALEHGFSGVGFADSPTLFADPLVEATRVLTESRAALAGPCILSLPLIHPSKVASALSTLAWHAPHQLVAVVGRGESSLANEGLRPPGLTAYAAMLASLRGAVGDALGEMTLLGAASGPRTIDCTAAELGGVLLDVGTSPEAVRDALTRARTANPHVTVWAFVRATIADTEAMAQEDFSALLGSCARRMVSNPGFHRLSADSLDAVAALADAHDYRKHGRAGATGTSALQTDPALRAAADLVRSRFLIAGDSWAVGRGLAALAATGIDGLILAGGLPRTLDHLAELGAAAASLRA